MDSTLPTAAPSVLIKSYNDYDHVHGAVDALKAVRNFDPTYPPQQDADPEGDGFYRWLQSSHAIGRWVAVDSEGTVLGYIQVTAPYGYLTSYLSRVGYKPESGRGVLEIGKFFVDPAYQKHGVGALLFDEAVRFIRSLRKVPALAVVSTSERALAFYGHRGMENLGSFQGIHGENFVFVFEDH